MFYSNGKGVFLFGEFPENSFYLSCHLNILGLWWPIWIVPIFQIVFLTLTGRCAVHKLFSETVTLNGFCRIKWLWSSKFKNHFRFNLVKFFPKWRNHARFYRGISEYMENDSRKSHDGRSWIHKTIEICVFYKNRKNLNTEKKGCLSGVWNKVTGCSSTGAILAVLILS